MLSSEQMENIKILYRTAINELNELSIHMEVYGKLDNGLINSSESYEQGYRDAIECMCNILEIDTMELLEEEE